MGRGAPTRQGAHNWEQMGKQTALAAVDALAALPTPLEACITGVNLAVVRYLAAQGCLRHV